MAKRQVNVSAAIKEYLANNADVGPKDAAKAISESIGKTVSPTYVSNIKSTMGKPKKTPGPKSGKKAAHAGNGSIDLVTLASMKEIIGKVGADTARKLIEVLA
jgi:hypothetical protein